MAFVFKIKIDGSTKPPIWRKVKVNENLTFDDFHVVIQILFGWLNGHMYQFSPKGYGSTPNIRYNYKEDPEDWYEFSLPENFPFGEFYDAEKIKISDYFHSLKQKMIYIYDFGDDWKHIVELVEITNETILMPICLAGKGSDLVEDCGGIWGFYQMVEIVNNPKHPEHKSYMEWLGLEKGEKWDVNYFDLELTNEMLREVWEMRRMESL